MDSLSCSTALRTANETSSPSIVRDPFTSPSSVGLHRFGFSPVATTTGTITPPSSIPQKTMDEKAAGAMDVDMDRRPSVHPSSDVDIIDTSPLPLGKRKLNGVEPPMGAIVSVTVGSELTKKIKLDAHSSSSSYSSAMTPSLSTIENRPVPSSSPLPTSSITVPVSAPKHSSKPPQTTFTVIVNTKNKLAKSELLRANPKNKISKASSISASAKSATPKKKQTSSKATGSFAAAGATASSSSPSSSSKLSQKTELVTSKCGLVSLKNSKLIVNQKNLSAATWDGLSSCLRKRLAFTDWAVDLLLTKGGCIDEWPKQFWAVVGRLIHESDKEKDQVLNNHARKQLASYIEGARPTIKEELTAKAAAAVAVAAAEINSTPSSSSAMLASSSSNNVNLNSTIVIDAIALEPLAELIRKLAEKKAHGFTSQEELNAYHASTSTLSASSSSTEPSAEGGSCTNPPPSSTVSLAPPPNFESIQGVQVWRWELREAVEEESLWPEELQSLLKKRQLERLEIKKGIVDVLTVSSKKNSSSLVSEVLVLSSSPAQPSTAISNEKISVTLPETVADSVAVGTNKTLNPIDESTAASDVSHSVLSSGPPANVVQGTESILMPSIEKMQTLAQNEKVKKEKKEVVIDPIELQRLEEAKAALEEEKAKKKAAREQAAALREEKRAKKAQEESDKLAKAEKKKHDLKKSSGFLTGFLIKKSASPVPAPLSSEAEMVLTDDDVVTPAQFRETEFDKTFKPFYVKSNVMMAPINRCKKARSCKVAPNVVVNNLENRLEAKEAIQAFITEVPSFRRLPYNPHPSPKVSVREVVRAINDSLLTGVDATVYYKILQDRQMIPIKLLKFKEDVRPGYVGTWTKTSKVVGPRTPFGKDIALLRYDYDSEEEWEEEAADADADDVASNANDDEEEDEDSDALSDDWMCDDDEVEYLPGHEDEDEMAGMNDEDDEMSILESATEQARRKILETERKSKAAREGLKKKKKTIGPLLPVIKGPAWEESFCGESTLAPFELMRVTFLNDAYVGLDPFRFVSKPFLQSSSKQASNVGKNKPMEPDAILPGLAMQVETDSSGATIVIPPSEISSEANSVAAAVTNTTTTTTTLSAEVVPGTSLKPTILAAKPARPAKSLPKELVPSLISLILAHSRLSQPDLIDLVWDSKEFKLARATKGMIGTALKKIAVKASAGTSGGGGAAAVGGAGGSTGVSTKKGGVWKVDPEILLQNKHLLDQSQQTEIEAVGSKD